MKAILVSIPHRHDITEYSNFAKYITLEHDNYTIILKFQFLISMILLFFFLTDSDIFDGFYKFQFLIGMILRNYSQWIRFLFDSRRDSFQFLIGMILQALQ